jgi:hypothetical protein
MSIDGVLLARHEETDDNAARRFQGQVRNCSVHRL